MKTPNYLIQIAEPCHEDWNAMTPEDKGKFCKACCKTVVDFSHKTDLEIHTILMEKKNENVCGHFKTSQVNRVLNLRIALDDLPENMSITKRFALALLMAFGTVLFSFTDLKGQHIQNVQLADTDIVTYMKGKIARLEPKEDTIQAPDSLAPDQIQFHTMGAIAYIPEEPVDTALAEDPKETCEDITDSTSARTLTGEPALIDLPENDPAFTIFPNPSHGDFSVRYEVVKKCDVYVQLLDEKGMPVRTLVDVAQQYEGKYQIPVDTHDLPDGMYMVSSIIDNKRYTQRVLVAK